MISRSNTYMATAELDASTIEAFLQACDITGGTSLIDKHVEAITALARDCDVFVCLPTGYCKSLCYALLPIVFDYLLGRKQGTSIVVCTFPLTALMMEQKYKFITRGISAKFIGELHQDVSGMMLVKDGKVQLVYVY